MKHLRTAPTQTGFFETYAKLAKSITLSGVFAQVVSALTEIGGIFAAAYSSLLPIFPQLALPIAGAVALIGTAVLELGLRVLMPHTVDAVLYRRYSGLHLPMTIAIWVLTAVLLTASGVLSFSNSKTIVSEMTAEVQRDSLKLQGVQIRYNAEKANAAKVHRNDSTATAQQYAQRKEATTAAFAGQLNSAKRELSNIYNRERRSGQSYASAKDAARQKIADVEAEQAAALAAITTEQAAALAALKSEYKAAIEKAEQTRAAELEALESEYTAAATDRAANVAAYGGGLAYFTIVCMLLFTAAVILERIHAKGSGIAEKVELSQYDLNPSAFVEAVQALRDRVQYNIRSRIQAFAERTPPPPLPTPAPELYDPTQFANIAVTLKIEREADEDEQVIYIQPKRRAIGFHTRQTAPEAHTENRKNRKPKKGEISCAIKSTGKAAHETAELRQLKQRLKDYKKRLGRHTQKAKVQQRTKGEATRRTLEAIENNRKWVEHYTELLNQAEAAAKSRKQ